VFKNNTEYNGTAWTSASTINTGRYAISRFRNTNSGYCFWWICVLIHNTGSLTELYDGTGWTSTATMATGRASLAGAGTQTAGLAFGGISIEQQPQKNVHWLPSPTGYRFNLDYLVIKYI
jgi:hypothetical protein